jgi:hypothetical protein
LALPYGWLNGETDNVDPNATWQRICDLLRADDTADTRAELAEALRDLADWVENGRFFPFIAAATE